MAYKHEEVALDLVSEIADGHGGHFDSDLPAGARLPSETHLAAQHRVSVPTVRRALATLAQAGIVERRQGQGTFVRVDGPARALQFRSPTENLFAEAAGNAAATAIALDGRTIYHPQGPMASTERFDGNKAVRSREAAHYELLGRALELLSFGGNESVNCWVVTAESRVNVEWFHGRPSLDEAIAKLMPRLPSNEGGIPGLRVRSREQGRCDLFWLMHDPPVHLALRHRRPTPAALG